MDRKNPHVPEPRVPVKPRFPVKPRVPDKPYHNSLSELLIKSDDDSQPRAPDKQDDASRSVPLIKKKWTSGSVPLIKKKWNSGSVPLIKKKWNSGSVPLIKKKWTSVPLKDDNMRWLGAVRVLLPEDHSLRHIQKRNKYHPPHYKCLHRGLGVSKYLIDTEILKEIPHLRKPIEKLSNESRDQTVTGIGNMEIDNAVPVCNPVPPPPPPPNNPI